MNVVITDGGQRSTLALLRSLAHHGVSVTVGESNKKSLAGSSRYCAGTFVYRSPLDQPHDFVEDIVAELQRTDYDLLIPMTDISSFLISQNKPALSEFTRVAVMDSAEYLRATDKRELLLVCQEMNIPIPHTWFIKNTGELDSLQSELSFPVVVKPTRSRYLIDGRWVAPRVQYIDTWDKFCDYIRAWPAFLPAPIIQERIVGSGLGVFVLCNHGTVDAVFCHRRIREQPPSGGVSVLSESVPVDPALVSQVGRLMESLNWHGVAMVEFKWDRRDNTAKVMEVNARFWGSLQLAIEAGVDFPYLLFQLETKGSVETDFSYRVNVRNRWLLGDFSHLMARLLKSNADLDLPEGYPGRWAAFMSFLSAFRPGTYLEVLKWSDPQPFLYELEAYLLDLYHRRIIHA